VALSSASSVTSAIQSLSAATEQAALTQLASANVRTSSSFVMPVNSNMTAFQVGSLTPGILSISTSIGSIGSPASVSQLSGSNTDSLIASLSSSSAVTGSSSAVTGSSSAVTGSSSAITVGNSGILSNSSALVGQSVPEVTFFATNSTSTKTISWLLTGGYPALVDNFIVSTSPSLISDYGINDRAAEVRVGAYSRLSLFQDINLSGAWNLVIDNPTNSPVFYDLRNSDFSDASSFYLTPSGTSSFYVGLVQNDNLANTASSAVSITNLSEVGRDLGVNWGRYTVQSASSTTGVIPPPNTYYVIEAIN
jgi:hypothetical protein